MPADDLTDPAPATTFAHLDATTVLSRGIAGAHPSKGCPSCALSPTQPQPSPQYLTCAVHGDPQGPVGSSAHLLVSPKHSLSSVASEPFFRLTCAPMRLGELFTLLCAAPRPPAELGIYPAVDPLDSTSRMLNPRILGDEHYAGGCG